MNHLLILIDLIEFWLWVVGKLAYYGSCLKFYIESQEVNVFGKKILRNYDDAVQKL